LYARPLNRRRLLRVFVRRYQFRFVLANLFFFALVGSGFIGLLFGPLVYALLDASVPLEDQSETASAFLVLHSKIWLLLGLVALAGSVRLAIVSHRVAGPLVRFTRIFKAIQAGDVSMAVKIRTTDYLHPEAEALDAAVRTLRRRLAIAQKSTRQLDEALGQLILESGALPARHQVLVRAASRATGRINEQLRRFQTTPRMATDAQRLPHGGDGAMTAVPTDIERQAGFTLIELLVVIAIIGTIAGIAFPVYASALDAAKVARTIADIRAMSREIEITKITTGHPPDSLEAAGLVSHDDPYGRPYVYLRIDNLKGKGAVRKDRKLNPLNSDYDLYSVGRDGKTKQQVNNKDSLDDIIRASDGGYFGLARDF